MNKILILSVMLVFCLASTSALQLQLLPNGTLIDSNVTNGTFMQIIVINNTIYLIESPEVIQDITYENNTYLENFYENITHINTTCLNCTNTYVSNYSGNVTNFTYSRSEIDSKINEKISPYISKSEANGKFALKGDINNTQTQTIVEKSGSTTLWVLVILLYLLVIGFAIYYIKEN